MLDDELVSAARRAQANAYAPYSRYRVGAAVRTASGAIFSACNVENAAYPLGTCAEAGVIAAMTAGGDYEIVEVVVATDGNVPGTPCGGCRQRLREFAKPATPVTSISSTGAVVVHTVAELLPDSFGPEFLE